jgi:hypothetical protein
MASFRKRGNRWHVRVRKNSVDRSGWFRNKSEAQAWALQNEVEIEDNKHGAGRRIRLSASY